MEKVYCCFVCLRGFCLVVFDSILPNPICVCFFLRKHSISKQVVDGKNLEPAVFLES